MTSSFREFFDDQNREQVYCISGRGVQVTPIGSDEMGTELKMLRDYVTAADGEQFSRLPEGVVSVNISHSNIMAQMIELKFDLHQTVSVNKYPSHHLC